MQIRVRVSVLVRGKDEITENGSALNETDSKATARVLAVWLIRTGFLLVAAFAVIKQANRRKGKKKPLTAQRRQLVLIKGSAPTRFPKMTLGSGEVIHSFEGPPWSVTRLKSIYHFGFGPHQEIFDEPG
jgi:hypothetical protein